MKTSQRFGEPPKKDADDGCQVSSKVVVRSTGYTDIPKVYQNLIMPVTLPVALDLGSFRFHKDSALRKNVEMHSPRHRQRHTAENVGHNKASTHEAACYEGVAPIQAAQGSAQI